MNYLGHVWRSRVITKDAMKWKAEDEEIIEQVEEKMDQQIKS